MPESIPPPMICGTLFFQAVSRIFFMGIFPSIPAVAKAWQWKQHFGKGCECDIFHFPWKTQHVTPLFGWFGVVTNERSLAGLWWTSMITPSISSSMVLHVPSVACKSSTVMSWRFGTYRLCKLQVARCLTGHRAWQRAWTCNTSAALRNPAKSKQPKEHNNL